MKNNLKTFVILLGCILVSQASYAREKITSEVAKKIALENQSGKVRCVSLEKEKGKTIYSVHLLKSEDNKEVEILIDATTGKIVSIEAQTENSEKDDDKSCE